MHVFLSVSFMLLNKVTDIKKRKGKNRTTNEGKQGQTVHKTAKDAERQKNKDTSIQTKYKQRNRKLEKHKSRQKETKQ